MMDLEKSFSGTQGKEVAKQSHLEGDAIHIVKIKEVKEEKVTFKSGEEKETVVITFADADDKIFDDKIFELDEKSVERKENNWGGLNPSGLDNTMMKFRCYLANFAPKLNERINNGEQAIKLKTWKQLKNTMLTIFKAVAASEQEVWCKLKLVKNSNGFASLPFFCGINKDGDPYVKNNFIGNLEILKAEGRDIAFSASELKAIKDRAEKLAANNATKKEELTMTSGTEDIDSVTSLGEDIEGLDDDIKL